MQTDQSKFSRVLLNLVIDSGYVRRNGSPDWVRFVASVPDVGYETLRKALAEERPASETLMRRVALALNVEPTVFTEYRLIQARRQLDPDQVGWTRAVQVLARWEGASADVS